MSRKQLIRLISPWTTRIETEEAIFSVDITTEEADALLCEWAPSPELFSFPRRKAWYCCEPQCQFRYIQSGTWPKIKATLKPSEFLYHGHQDERYRVSHITHFEPLEMNCNPQRKDRAIAIVSNHGGSPLFRHRDIAFRNKLVTDSCVDLFGRKGWHKYRSAWYSFSRLPSNYKGELPGDWPAQGKRQLMSKYKVCVCLENMNEPGYFTEKFVEAVQAGCIPVYRAGKDIRETILQGALWFDPGDNCRSQSFSISTALQADLTEVQIHNIRWLQNNTQLHKTHAKHVFHKIATALCD